LALSLDPERCVDVEEPAAGRRGQGRRLAFIGRREADRSLVPALRAGLLSGRREDECAAGRPDPKRGDALVQDASRDDLLQLFGSLFGHGLANVGSRQFRSELPLDGGGGDPVRGLHTGLDAG
jgi:hypothetical protein